MAIPEKLKGKYFYHFTHIDNLDSILQNGLLSTNEKKLKGLTHENIANGNIQERRANMTVTCTPAGSVHDYVPFYFCSTNPMLLGLTNLKNIDQPYLIFFAIPIEKILEENVIFTNASANTITPPSFFDNPTDLSSLDWDAIDDTKWAKKTDEFMHRKMAEVLIHKSVPLDWIKYIIVWNKEFYDAVTRSYAKFNLTLPILKYGSLNYRHFYFTKFPLGRLNETLTTGPKYLSRIMENVTHGVINRKDIDKKFNFQNLTELLKAIDFDFCVLNELKGIFELETINEIHHENVSDHTLKVVQNVITSEYFKNCNENDQSILKLAAYLHDIGKGPKEMWKKYDFKQMPYPDHPVDSLLMTGKILLEQVENFTEYEIKMLCLLVGYHDLIGEIFGKGRDKKQLFDNIKTIKEFEMLNCLSYADVLSFNNLWSLTYGFRIIKLREEFLKQI